MRRMTCDSNPLDMGFTVQRTYEAVDDPEDVQRDEDGTWRIKAGARVRDPHRHGRQHATLSRGPGRSAARRSGKHQPRARRIGKHAGRSRCEPAPYGWWWGPWYEHQNLRDARAEAFTSLLWEGVYQYSYVARATTPGEYVVPPAKAEEMYSPEVFGRSASDRVIVE